MALALNFRMPDVSYLNMFGELQADALGTSAIYQANDPVSYFVDSVNRLNAFMTQRGGGIAQQFQQQRRGNPPDWKIDTSQLPPARNTPPSDEELDWMHKQFPVVTDDLGNPVPCGISTIWMKDGKQVPAGTPGAKATTQMRSCDRLPDQSGVGEKLDKLGLGFAGDDIAKRVFLGLLALIIIAAAVFSLR